jgi:hypothetical protein
VFSSREPERDLPLAVHVIRLAGLLSLFAGLIMMVGASTQLGIAIILLSALYIALAEIINYLAIIAGNSQAAQRLVEDPAEDMESAWPKNQGRSRHDEMADLREE